MGPSVFVRETTEVFPDVFEGVESSFGEGGKGYGVFVLGYGGRGGGGGFFGEVLLDADFGGEEIESGVGFDQFSVDEDKVGVGGGQVA